MLLTRKNIVPFVLRFVASWFLFFTVLLPVALAAQQGAQGGEWRTWGGDLGATRYAPLDQISSSTFNQLSPCRARKPALP